jgi:hypothetical protein
MGAEQNGDINEIPVMAAQVPDGTVTKWRRKLVKNLAGKMCHFAD